MASSTQSDSFAVARQMMADTQLRARGIRDERVLEAMARVPRHKFVAENYRSQAYEDHPLPIGEDQTISQPYIVALALQALTLEPSDTVLEVGSGSGYQTALLAELSARVYSVERHAALAKAAQAILSDLGYRNVTVMIGDGAAGLQVHSPFDAIIVSAATPEIPPILLQQLREGGRMVVPVGPPDAQELQLVRKHEGKAAITVLEGCRFVPLVTGN